MDKKELYETKYKKEGLPVSPYFKKQFQYIQKKYIKRNNLKILDLGGGTGEFSLLLQELNNEVTLFDFSKEAAKKAKDMGVLSIICNDFLTYDFKDDKYDVVFVKGFSLLNTDDKDTFLALIERMKGLLTNDGYIVYMGQTDLSASWTESGWYQLGTDDINNYFTDSLILPAFRYQLSLPLIVNKGISSSLSLLSSLPRSMTLVGIIK